MQNCGTFLWTLIFKTWKIRLKKVFGESVTFRLRDLRHAQLIFRTVIKKLWAFFRPWGRDRSQSLQCWKTLIFSGESNTAIHGLREDVMARWIQDVRRPLFWHDCVSIIRAAVSHQYYTALYYIVLIDPCRSRVTGVRSGYSVHQQIPSRENSLSCTRQVIHVIVGCGKTKGAMHDFVSPSLSNAQCSEQLPAGYMRYTRVHSFIHSWQSSCINLRCRILVQVTINRRLQIDRDGHLDQSEAYDIS